MQLRLGIWQRFIANLLVGDRCAEALDLAEVYYKSISGHFGKGLIQVYSWVTDAAEAGDLGEIYYKFISGGQMQLRLGIWQRFITSLLVGDRSS